MNSPGDAEALAALFAARCIPDLDLTSSDPRVGFDFEGTEGLEAFAVFRLGQSIGVDRAGVLASLDVDGTILGLLPPAWREDPEVVLRASCQHWPALALGHDDFRGRTLSMRTNRTEPSRFLEKR